MMGVILRTVGEQATRTGGVAEEETMRIGDPDGDECELQELEEGLGMDDVTRDGDRATPTARASDRPGCGTSGSLP